MTTAPAPRAPHHVRTGIPEDEAPAADPAQARRDAAARSLAASDHAKAMEASHLLAEREAEAAARAASEAAAAERARVKRSAAEVAISMRDLRRELARAVDDQPTDRPSLTVRADLARSSWADRGPPTRCSRSSRTTRRWRSSTA